MTPRFLADEDFHYPILRGLARRVPDLDLIRVQDVGLAGHDDSEVLECAARMDRILLTHDVNTMVETAYNRLSIQGFVPGVIAVRQSMPIGQVIDQLCILIECSMHEEWEGMILFLPL